MGVEASAPRAGREVRLAVFLLALSGLPLVLILLGVDLGSARDSTAGPALHTLLEWGAVCAALFTAALGFLRYRTTRDGVTAVIAIALLSAGLMDGFHVLAAAGLVPASDGVDFIPFTWALSRIFAAAILLVGAGLALRPGLPPGAEEAGRLIKASAALCVGLAAVLMLVSAFSPDLPRTQFSGRLYTRPWDVAPLAIFLFGATWAFPQLHRRFGSTFSLALWLSAIPHVATQLHAAFGSSALYDAHDVAAHVLKVVAYLVPLAGLMVDYVETHRALETSRAGLERRAAELRRTNEQLEAFASVASQDLQVPLRELADFVDRIDGHFREGADEEGANYIAGANEGSLRLQSMLNGLLLYMQVRKGGKEPAPTDAAEVAAKVKEALAFALERRSGELTIGELPPVRADRGQLTRLLRLLLDNAIRFAGEAPPKVSLTAVRDGDRVVFEVRDEGIGFAPAHAREIFDLFRQLDPESAGTGVGLSVARYIVERHGGTLEAESRPGEGATFRFDLPAAGAL